MTFILLFFALAFGFSLLLFSFFLHLHNKSKERIVINGILGIALILFFLFQGDFIEFCWEMVVSIHKKVGDDRRAAFTFWELVSIWKKEPELSGNLILFFIFLPIVYWSIKYFIFSLKGSRETLKLTDMYSITGWIVGLGSQYALLFIVNIILLFFTANAVFGFLVSLMTIL